MSAARRPRSTAGASFAFIGLMLGCTMASALAQAPSASQARDVLASEDARFSAMVRADTAALARLLADDLLYVHSSGRAEARTEFLAAVGSGSIRYLAFEVTERQVTMLNGAAAHVMGRAAVRVALGGAPQTADVRYVAVYGSAGGRWQLRGWQTTRVASPETRARPPRADWDVYTVVTWGDTFYQGVKTRAVLSYGEIGNPELVVEVIFVETGFPSPNEVRWRAELDVGGGMPDDELCPLAETWCGRVGELRWDRGVLHHAVETPRATFDCETTGVAQRRPVTTCVVRRAP